MTLHLLGLGHFHPENEITNRFLEELDIGTDDEWILERVGIRSRRSVLPLDYIRETRNREPRAALEAALHSNAELGTVLPSSDTSKTSSEVAACLNVPILVKNVSSCLENSGQLGTSISRSVGLFN